MGPIVCAFASGCSDFQLQCSGFSEWKNKHGRIIFFIFYFIIYLLFWIVYSRNQMLPLKSPTKRRVSAISKSSFRVMLESISVISFQVKMPRGKFQHGNHNVDP